MSRLAAPVAARDVHRSRTAPLRGAFWRRSASAPLIPVPARGGLWPSPELLHTPCGAAPPFGSCERRALARRSQDISSYIRLYPVAVSACSFAIGRFGLDRRASSSCSLLGTYSAPSRGLAKLEGGPPPPNLPPAWGLTPLHPPRPP